MQITWYPMAGVVKVPERIDLMAVTTANFVDKEHALQKISVHAVARDSEGATIWKASKLGVSIRPEAKATSEVILQAVYREFSWRLRERKLTSGIWFNGSSFCILEPMSDAEYASAQAAETEVDEKQTGLGEITPASVPK